MKSFEDLDIWKQARQLVQEIYRLTKTEKFSRDFDLRHQIQGATVSIMSNIAEGFERGGNQEFIQFLYSPKAHVVRCVHNSMSLSTKVTFPNLNHTR